MKNEKIVLNGVQVFGTNIYIWNCLKYVIIKEIFYKVKLSFENNLPYYECFSIKNDNELTAIIKYYEK